MSTQKHELTKESDSLTAEELIRLMALTGRHESVWRNYPFLVSLIGLCLSIVTGIASIYIAHRKDIHDQRAELAAAINSIQDLRLKRVEIRDKGSAYEQTAGGLMGNQIYALTLGAADLIVELGTYAPTAAIIPISDFLYYNGLYSKAEELVHIALAASRSAQDETTALKSLGAMKIKEGTPASISEGNRYFAQALDFEKKYGSLRFSSATDFIKIGIQLQWAEALAPIDCADAQNHFRLASEILGHAGNSLDLDRLRSSASQKYITGIGGIASCKPLSP